MSNNLSDWIDIFKWWMDAHPSYRLHWEQKVGNGPGYGNPREHAAANLLFTSSQPTCWEHPNLHLVLDILDIMERNDLEGDLLRCALANEGNYPAGRIEHLRPQES